jgi:hypothetical protein
MFDTREAAQLVQKRSIPASAHVAPISAEANPSANRNRRQPAPSKSKLMKRNVECIPPQPCFQYRPLGAAMFFGTVAMAADSPRTGTLSGMEPGFFQWVSMTPAANLVLVLAIGVIVLIFFIATILCVVAFVKHFPLEFFGFKVWTTGLICQTGVVELDVPQDWKRGRQPGRRWLTRVVDFDKPFHTEDPKVLLSLSRVDILVGDRLEVSTMNISSRRFTIGYGTWEDTEVHGLSVSWIAIGY